MTKQEKNDVIEVLKGKFKQYNNFYVTDTESLTVAQITKLRRHCFDKQVEMRVAKNTLIKKALESLDSEKYAGVFDSLHNVTALLFSENPKEPALILTGFRKQSKGEKPGLKAAFINGDVFVGDNQLKALTQIKTKNELIGEVIGLLQAPIQRVLGALQNKDAAKSGESVSTPVAEVLVPTTSVVKPTSEVTPPVEAAAKPLTEATAPATVAQQTVEAAPPDVLPAKPVTEAPASNEATVSPANEAPVPAAKAEKPVTEKADPIEAPAKPANEVPAPIEEPMKTAPTTEADNPAVKAIAPNVTDEKPADEATTAKIAKVEKPAAKATSTDIEDAKPGVDNTTAPESKTPAAE